MAKLTYTDLYDRLNPLYTFYSNTEMSIVLEWKTQAVLHDMDGGEYLAMQGEDIEYSGGSITSGTIHTLLFKNPDGDTEAKISGLDLDAATLSDTLFDDGSYAFVSLALAGNDTVKGAKGGEWIDGYAGKDKIDGGKGDDWIFGSEGRDTLIGGKGMDYFFFEAGDGKDKILDFDADGGEGKQDFIDLLGIPEPEIVKDGKDTLIRCGDGDEIRLVGVHKSHVDWDHDFKFLS